MNTHEELKVKMGKIADVDAASAVLGWDQETYMPAAGATYRAQQLGTLAGIRQEMLQDPELRTCALNVLDTHPEGSEEHDNARLILCDLDKSQRITPAFAAAFSQATSMATAAWQKAKHADDFASFAPHLATIVRLSREKATLIDETRDPYEVLIGTYEPGAAIETIDEVFAQIKEKVIPLYDKVRALPLPETPLLAETYDAQAQRDLMRLATEAIGFDYARGRADLVEHPFCTAFGPDDVRITSRVKEDDIIFGLWSSIHEAGHAMYNQGLPREHYGLPLGSAENLSIHESQSRIWENNVGRSRAFAEYLFPHMAELFPAQCKGYSAEDLYRAVNVIKPWPIRIEADEVTYHIHILIRYEIEKDLISGALAAEDAHTAWREKYAEYLGIDIARDAGGVLQDVHWSFGFIGYFPTYTLGSLYAAQFFAAAEEVIGDLSLQMQRGEFGALLEWLRVNVHAHGNRYSSEELCTRITGSGLSVDPFVAHMEKKIEDIY